MAKDEHFREMLNDIHDGDHAFNTDDLIELVLWIERKHDEVKNEAVSKLTQIGLTALEQLKETM